MSIHLTFLIFCLKLPNLSDSRNLINQHASPQIAGGSDVPPNKYPFYVRITLHLTNTGFYCGGSILSRHTILTAAHCLENEDGTQMVDTSRIEVTAGDFTPSYNDELNQTTRHDVFAYAYLKGFHGSRIYFGFDIAVIILKDELHFDVARKPLIPCREKRKPDLTRYKLVSIGLGIGAYGHNHRVLQEVDVEEEYANASGVCRNYYMRYGLMVCLKGINGLGACPGDSGGPTVLVERATGQPTCVYSIISYGGVTKDMDCSEAWYGVDTRVSPYNFFLRKYFGIRGDNYASRIKKQRHP